MYNKTNRVILFEDKCTQFKKKEKKNIFTILYLILKLIPLNRINFFLTFCWFLSFFFLLLALNLHRFYFLPINSFSSFSLPFSIIFLFYLLPFVVLFLFSLYPLSFFCFPSFPSCSICLYFSR
jgi:hypothetical protein